MLNGAPVRSIEEVVRAASIVFLAIPMTAHRSVISKISSAAQEGTILVDVSNRPLAASKSLARQKEDQIADQARHIQRLEEGLLVQEPTSHSSNCTGSCPHGICFREAGLESQAAWLQEMLPLVHVVKAFNTISAYSLNASFGENVNDRVHVCSDHDRARRTVMDLVQRMGMVAMDAGPLTNASQLEELPGKLFPQWKVPVIISTVFFVLAYTYVAVRDVILNPTTPWERIALVKFNIVMAWHATLLFTATIIPGILAAIVQLFRNSARSRFPNWLAEFLNARKGLGILGLYSAIMHAIASAMVNSLFIDTDYIDSISGFAYQISVITAILTTALYLTLGISSLPGVSATFSWREWQFIQSKLGLLAFVGAFVHISSMSYAVGDLLSFSEWPYYLPPVSVVACTPVALCLLCRLILGIWPLGSRLDRIRGLA